jgi:hypothetical protein
VSTDQPHTPGDRALARRYHFLGLPGEKSNQAVSFAGLRSELGDENAGALVTRLGVLAKVHNLDQLGIPLHHAVDRILQSLSADERRTISQGGAIPSRVEAIIRAEGETAKLQMAQLGKGPDGLIRDAAHATGPLALGQQPFAALRNASSPSSASASATTQSPATAMGGSPAQIARWQLEGTPLGNMTGLNTGVYAQLRGEGYSQAQIGAAAGDLSKIRNFSSADVSHYTPYFVDTSKKFRAEAKSVIESNGTKKFQENDSVTEANAQAELHGGSKIEHRQMNSLGQLVYDSGIDRETLRRQPGEAARKKFFGDHMREHFNGFELDDFNRVNKESPAKGEEYKRQHGVPIGEQKAKKDEAVINSNKDNLAMLDTLEKKAEGVGAKPSNATSASEHSKAEKSSPEQKKSTTNAPEAGEEKDKNKNATADAAKDTPKPVKEASAKGAKPSGPSRG